MLVTFAIGTDSTPCAPLLAATDEFPRDNAFSPRVREKASERPERGSQANHRDERQQAADDRHPEEWNPPHSQQSLVPFLCVPPQGTF